MKSFFSITNRIINLFKLIRLWYVIKSNKNLKKKYGQFFPAVCDALWAGRLKRLRPAYLLGSVIAAWQAKKIGLDKIIIIEFGVGTGTGLKNLIEAGKLVSSYFDLEVKVYGFDNCSGLPHPKDERDHPEIWSKGQFNMTSNKKELFTLVQQANCELVQGDINTELIKDALAVDLEFGGIGFVSIDVDYYSSTKPILDTLATIDANKILPAACIYFDDVFDNFSYNVLSGEELAIAEFNTNSKSRVLALKIPSRGIFSLNVLDNKFRTGEEQVLEHFEIPSSLLNEMIVK